MASVIALEHVVRALCDRQEGRGKQCRAKKSGSEKQRWQRQPKEIKKCAFPPMRVTMLRKSA